MTDSESSKIQPQLPGPQAEDLVAPALILTAGVMEISAEAEEHDRAGSDAPRNPSGPGAPPPDRNPVVRRRRGPARRPRVISEAERSPVTTNPTAPVAPGDDVEGVSQSDTR